MPGPLFWLYLPQHLLIIVFKHPLVWDTGTLPAHSQGQMGRDLKSSREVEKAQENTIGSCGNCLGDTEGDGEGLAQKAVNRES